MISASGALNASIGNGAIGLGGAGFAGAGLTAAAFAGAGLTVAGFGGAIEVLEPEELREQLGALGAQLVDRYRNR